MKIIPLSFILLFVMTICLSCSVSPVEYDVQETYASVNGFNVKWHKNISPRQKQAITGILDDMIFVNGGLFMMGNESVYDEDARANESPIHPVVLTDYYIMAHEISYEQVCDIIGKQDNMYETSSGQSIHFNYDDWKYFIDVINCYCGLELTLPTEAQWEYAARGGIHSQGFKYPGSNNWNNVWSAAKDSLFKSSTANELGIFNMADGYGEWCLDYYGNYAATATPLVNPCCSESTDEHVVRGGCFASQGTSKWWEETLHSASDYGVAFTGNSANSSYNDKRMCRSTARAHNYSHIGASIVRCRLVCNTTE